MPPTLRLQKTAPIKQEAGLLLVEARPEPVALPLLLVLLLRMLLLLRVTVLLHKGLLGKPLPMQFLVEQAQQPQRN